MRLMLVVVLIVAGWSAAHSGSALATVGCHDATISHAPASGSAHPSGKKLLHCLTATGACCTMALQAASEAAIADHATTLVWVPAPVDDLSGHRLEIAPPPPRI
jgi:hypothetical protein